MPYIDGLPPAASVSPDDLIAVDQGGNGTPGSATTRRAKVSQLPNGGGGGVSSVVGQTGAVTLSELVTGGVATSASVTAETSRAEAAESTLQANINTETNARIAAVAGAVPAGAGKLIGGTASAGVGVPISIGANLTLSGNTLSATGGGGGGVSSVVGATGAVTLANLVTGGVAPSASPTITGTADVNSLVVTAASPGQTVRFTAGGGNYNAAGSTFIDASSAAFFTASISGNTLTVTGVSAGFIAADLYVTAPGVTLTLITGQLTGTPGGAGTYSLDMSQAVSSRAMSAYAFSTAFTGYGSLNQPGGQVFGIFGRADLNVNGLACNELDSFNNTGFNPTSAFPPDPVFGTTDRFPIALTLAAFGNAQSKVACWIAGTSPSTFQAGIYINAGAASLFGLAMGSTGTIGPQVGLDIAAIQTGTAAQFRLEGSPTPTTNIVLFQNPAGAPIAGVQANSDIWNAGGRLTGTGVLILGAGIQGMAGATSAPAGIVGEFQSAVGSNQSLTLNTPSNLASFTLSAGDWDVEATGEFTGAASTITQAMVVCLNTASGTLLPTTSGQTSAIAGLNATGAGMTLTTPTVRFNLASPATIFCVGECSFTTSTMTGNANIRARRVR